MKKNLFLGLLVILWLFAGVYFVSAESLLITDREQMREQIKQNINNLVREQIENETRARIQEFKEERKEIKEDLRNSVERFRDTLKANKGKIIIEGRNLTIKELSNEKKEIIAGKINAKTGLNLTAEEVNGSLGSVLRVYLSNGNKADVRVMPDKAAFNALKKIGAKCGNCTLELKEVGVGNRTRAVWTMETEQNSSFLWMFSRKMIVRAEVDSETGEVLSVKRPWWAFASRMQKTNQSEIEKDLGI